MNRPLFSILHTSARPNKWREIYDAWIKAAVNPEQVEYVLCVDERWGFTREMFVEQFDAMARLQPRDIKITWNTQRRCYVDGVNTAAQASTGRILIVNADDQYPCEGWDQKLELALAKCGGFTSVLGLEEADYVVEVSTGTVDEHNRGILVMPILSRARYERLGYVFYPEYESMYADNDFCEHARQDGVIIDASYLLFPHRHPYNEGNQAIDTWDEQYRAQNRQEAYRLGHTLFRWRRNIRFGEAITEAEQIEGWMSTRELLWLSLHASQMDSVTEVGCWKGRSTYALASGCAGQMYAVDHFQGTKTDPIHQAMVKRSGGSTYEDFATRLGKFRNLNIVRADSLSGAQQVPDTDMVFLDAGHEYEQVKSDLLACAPKAKKLICGHDAKNSEVFRAVTEVLGDVKVDPETSIWYKAFPRNIAAPQVRTLCLCLSGEIFHSDWVNSLLTLYGHLVNRGFAVCRAYEYTSNVYVTREQIARMVMKADPPIELCLWIDDDNPAPTPDQFDRLLQQLDAHPECDGITGWCWIYDKTKRNFYVSCGVWSPDGAHWRPFEYDWTRSSEVREVEATGFPCFLMKRSALEKAGANAFIPMHDTNLEHETVGEDHAFCRRAEANGAKFLADPTVRVNHLKYCDVEPQLPAVTIKEPKVAVMMRVRNESRWIERVINSVKPLAGENIFVMEDGSIDETPELVLKAGAHLLPSPFIGQPLDERRDKNWLLQQVKEACDPDWIFMPDGDEELEPGGSEKILRILRTDPNVDCYGVQVLNLWNSVDQVRMDGVYGKMARESLFRPIPGMEFKSYYEGLPGHNHVGLHTSNAPYKMRTAMMNVFVLHYGYVFAEDRLRKYNWILSIDPENEHEDFYRHTVQGDIPEVPADMVLKHGGPLKLQKLPARMIPKFEVMPGPIVGIDPRTKPEAVTV